MRDEWDGVTNAPEIERHEFACAEGSITDCRKNPWAG